MKCQRIICTWKKLAESSEQETEVTTMGGTGGSLQQNPWQRGGDVLKPWFSPTTTNQLCLQCNTLGTGKSLPLSET